MAAWHDLRGRVQALEEGGLTVASDYKGDGLPKWLMPALGEYDVYVLNVKGVALNDTLCMIRLGRLEKMLTQYRSE